MCHNHSHLAGYVPGVDRTGRYAVHTVVLLQPLTVEMPTGERLILPCYTTLFALLPPPAMLCSPELRQTVALSIALCAADPSAFASAPEIPLSSRTGSFE